MMYSSRTLQSLSYKVDSFVDTKSTMRQHGINSRLSIQKLVKTFRRTRLGSQFTRMIEGKHPKGILLEISLTDGPTLKEMKKYKLFQVEGKNTGQLSKIVINLDPGSNSLEVIGFDTSGSVLGKMKPVDARYKPVNIDIEMYLIYLVNVCQKLSSLYPVVSSTPTSFKRISRESKLRIKRK